MLKNSEVNISTVKKILFAALVSGVIFLLYAGDLNRYLSFSYARASLEQLLLLYDNHGAAFIAAFAAAYTIITALSIPAATVMTLLAGAIFGLFPGVVVVSFASSAGATLACAAARYVLRDWVQARFREKLAPVNEGVEREGVLYLFALRLVPAAPFFVVNAAMGITRMPLFKFYWVSQLGMLPLTLLYVNAGRELSRIDSPAGILSPGLMITLVLAGVFPIAAKRVLAAYRAKKRP